MILFGTAALFLFSFASVISHFTITSVSFNVVFFSQFSWKNSPIYSVYHCSTFSFYIMVVPFLDLIHPAKEHIFSPIISCVFLCIPAISVFCSLFFCFIFAHFWQNHFNPTCWHLFLIFSLTSYGLHNFLAPSTVSLLLGQELHLLFTLFLFLAFLSTGCQLLLLLLVLLLRYATDSLTYSKVSYLF